MEVQIDKKFEGIIRSMIDKFKRQKDTELEFRFGKFEKGFHAGINKSLFFKILRTLNVNDDYTLKEETFQVVRYTHKYKQLVCADNRIENILKYKLEKIDIDYSEFVCRLALSVDKMVEDVPDGEAIINSCEKHRFTFTHKSNDYKIDLSIIDEKFYDIELEYLNRDISYENFIKSFSFIYSLLSSTKYILPYLERLDIVKQFNSIFSQRPESKTILLKFNKPENLIREELPNLKTDFVVNPKLDGVRYFLFVKDGNAYLLNNKQILKYDTNLNNSLNDSILDVEKIGDDIIVFDVLYVNRKSLINETFLNRMSYAQKFPYKKNETEQDVLKGLLKFKNYKNIDGVIFYPKNQGYYNRKTYKYKPINTIDFYVEKDNDKFKLMYLVPNRKMAIFEGTEKYPFSGFIEPTEKELEIIGDGNKIVEFSYSDNMFHPIRVRDDKEYPNYLDVVNRIWRDINEPITEKEILSHLQPLQIEEPKKESSLKTLDHINILLDMIDPSPSNLYILKNSIQKKVFPNYSFGFFNKVKDNLYEIKGKILPNNILLTLPIKDKKNKYKDITSYVIDTFQNNLTAENKLFTDVYAYTDDEKNKLLEAIENIPVIRKQIIIKKEEEKPEIKVIKKEEVKAQEIVPYKKLERKSILTRLGQKEKLDNALNTRDYVLIRQYAPTEGSCFFHSVLEAIDDDYRKLKTVREKEKHVKVIRKNLQEFYNDIDKFSLVNNGNTYLIEVLEKLRQTIDALRRKKLDPKSKQIRYQGEIFSADTFNSFKSFSSNDYEYAQLLTKLLLPENMIVDGKFSLKDFRNKYVDLHSNFIKSRVSNVNVDELKNFLLLILKGIEDKVLDEFTSELGDVGCWFDQQLLSLLTNFFNVDIYILREGRNGEIFPVRQSCEELIKNRTSVIVFNIHETHYESVIGYDVKNKKGTIAFAPNHPLIQKIRKITCDEVESLNNDEYKVFYDYYKKGIY